MYDMILYINIQSFYNHIFILYMHIILYYIYRTGSSHMNATSLKLHLCVGAESEDPAHCFTSSPHYLNPEEKVKIT